jgi:hypothetical protein
VESAIVPDGPAFVCASWAEQVLGKSRKVQAVASKAKSAAASSTRQDLTGIPAALAKPLRKLKNRGDFL